MLLTSCSRFSRLLKSSDMNLKFNAAVEYYEKKKFYNALQLFEELVPLNRGTSKAEETYYYYSMCHFYINDYISAAYHLNNFVQQFPASKHAEEAAFNNAYCYYLDSPGSSLDQQSTLDAIKQFQIFADRYPESAKLPECNKLVDELRAKLETKAYDNARLYYKMEDYKAAVVAFNNVIKDFPATNYKEECLFLSLKSAYLYAINSIDIEKEERFKSTIENYSKLIEAFPDSKYKREADRIEKDSKEKIDALKYLNLPNP
ncbi:MAG: outer membrane protein assembly factor BamD [Bacteroidetes bacterium]|nr:outer membrane protein assembly factor BamD [Bacteroidota bacterium]